jgi:hypothetical protein
MFGLLRLAFTLLICLLIVGLYLGWFSFTKAAPDPQTNKVNINVSVDKKKMGSDLKTFEQNVSKRIQDMNPPSPNGTAPPSGQLPLAPGLNLGPVSVEPSNPLPQATSAQSTSSGWSVGPFSLQPASPSPPTTNGPSASPGGSVPPFSLQLGSPPAGPSNSQPQLRLQTQDYQFSVPLNVPPPSEGR